jgi:amphi-Trp domain-containing protein
MTAHPGRREPPSQPKTWRSTEQESEPRAHGDTISNFRHKGEEGLSRQQAAERLIDLAYALTTGGPLKLDGDQQVNIADEVVMKRDGNSKDDRVLLEIELSWSTKSAVAPAPPGIEQS